MPRSSPVRAAALGLAAGLALSAVSCGGDGPKLYPVTGKVLFNGQPVEGASVVFVPDGGGDLRPSGTTDEDGSFSLSTYPHGEGAPAGNYVVLVTKYPENARELETPKSELPTKYADQAAALLKATVQEERTDLAPFQLTK